MNNIFDTLVNNAPKPKPEDVARLKELEATKKPVDTNRPLADMSTKDIIRAWQQDQTQSDYTAELLRRMQPTIRSAMTSYAPGMDSQLGVKAAHLTLDALRGFDPTKGAEPTTYVFHNLKRLSRYGAKASSIIPQPEGFALEQKKVHEAIERFTDDNRREPSMVELADYTGLSVKRLRKLLDANTVVNESSTLTDDSGKDTMTQSGLTDNDYFEYVYASVGPIDQKIMEWTSGLHGVKPLSNNDIAKKLRISPAAVSQRKGKIQQLLSDVRSLV